MQPLETQRNRSDSASGPPFASLSDIGRLRSENQDACAAFRDRRGRWLWLVADGMGGHKGGSTASRICVETVGRCFEMSQAPLPLALEHAIAAANEAVLHASRADSALGGMGTTVVAFAIGAALRGWVAWVGDSRAYRLRGGVLERLTEDHSLVAEWVRQQMLTAEQAATHRRRNELLRCIGLDEPLPVSVREVELRPGDRVLLCSDGLWGSVPEPEMAEIAGRESIPDAVAALVGCANARGGRDNISVVLAAIPVPAAAPEREPAPRCAWMRRAVALAVGIACALGALVLGRAV